VEPRRRGLVRGTRERGATAGAGGAMGRDAIVAVAVAMEWRSNRGSEAASRREGRRGGRGEVCCRETLCMERVTWRRVGVAEGTAAQGLWTIGSGFWKSGAPAASR